MNKYCKQYIREVKTLFPIIRKQERKYLSKLQETVEEYCEEEDVSSVEAIYKDFGYPNDVLSNYLSETDLPQLTETIRLSKWIKRGIIGFIIIALLGTSIFAVTRYKTYQLLKEESIYLKEETIK